MSALDTLKTSSADFGAAVSAMLKAATFPPSWDQELFAWRHPMALQNVTLFWLTKLAGIASTLEAATLLAGHGFWFQVAVLTRTVTESQLAITSTLPKPNESRPDWPSEKQRETVAEHFKETWEDPSRPFANPRQRQHMRRLAASIGHFQGSDGTLTQHDASQVALHHMRALSDFTHMAYPQLMELYDPQRGYTLTRDQPEGFVRAKELAGAVIVSFVYAEVVGELMSKVLAGAAAKSREESDPAEKSERLERKRDDLAKALRQLRDGAARIDAAFPDSQEEARRVLREFKTP